MARYTVKVFNEWQSRHCSDDTKAQKLVTDAKICMAALETEQHSKNDTACERPANPTIADLCNLFTGCIPKVGSQSQLITASGHGDARLLSEGDAGGA